MLKNWLRQCGIGTTRRHSRSKRRVPHQHQPAEVLENRLLLAAYIAGMMPVGNVQCQGETHSLTAAIENAPVSSAAMVASPQLTLMIDSSTVSEDGTVTASVHRNTDTTAALEVTALAADSTELTVPTSLTIPAGSNTVSFLIGGVNDWQVDGTQTTSVSVTAPGHPQMNVALAVTDVNTASVVVTENPGGVHVFEGADIVESPVETQDWGINLNNNVDWATAGFWVDVSKMFRQWGSVDAPWQVPEWTLPLTSEGVPQEDFGTVVANGVGGIPAGIYNLRFQGSAAVSAHGGWRVVPGSQQTVSGVTTMQIDVHTLQNSWLKFKGVSPVDPVRGMKMASVSYDINTTQVFSDQFLRRVQPFSTLRFMDWNGTNNSRVTTWSERRLPEETIQTPAAGSLGGVAWEHMIQLANDTQKDAWINIPHLADDTYVRELAKLWRDNLDPNLTLYVEWSNESWNSIFDQFDGPDLDGDGNPRDGHDYYLAGNAGPQTVRISQIFREEFGAGSDRLHVTLAGQSARDWVIGRGIQYMEDQGLVPSEVIDSIATAPYFSIPNNSTADNLDDLFAQMSQHTAGIQAHAAMASTHGLKLIAYEGGQHLAPNLHRQVPRSVLDAAQHDPRMADAYREFATIWAENDGGLFAHFALARADANSGYWALLNGINDPGDVKWDAAMGIVLPKGDMSLDGTVDFTDFQTLQANFGQSGMWWEQGDFNGDNTVDAVDLQLLYANGQFSTGESAAVIAFAEANAVTLFDHYTLALSSIPTSPVSVNLNTNGQLVTDPATIVFPADERALVPQTIYVAATDDLLSEGDHTSAVSHTVSSSDAVYNEITVSDVSVSITDNEPPAVAVAIRSEADAHESNSVDGQFRITLEDTVPVDVDVHYTVGGTATAGSDYTTLSGTATIPAGTFGVNLDVGVINDGIAEVPETVLIALIGTSLPQSVFVDAESATAAISIYSDDLNIIKTSKSTVAVSEDGTSETFEVTLGAQPSANVVVDLISGDVGEASVSHAVLTFSPSNWDQPQTITVTGIDDAAIDGTQNADVTLSIDVSSSATEFRYSPDEVIDVLIADNDVASTVANVEDVTFYNRDANLEDGLSVDKTGQRSIIKHVQVVLEGLTNITADSATDGTFVVNNVSNGLRVDLIFDSVVQTASRTIVVLSFAHGLSADASGLVDGNYQLIIDGSYQNIDADGSGTAGGLKTVNFHRLFGDTNGDRDVDNGDFGGLYRAFYGDTTYRSAFDRDDDNDLLDEIGSFFANYGRYLDPTRI